MSVPSERALDVLAERASQVCMQTAAEVIRKAGVKPADIRHDAAAAKIRDCLKEALPEALHDAREAIACNMTDAALATFFASVQRAGVKAGKAIIAGCY